MPEPTTTAALPPFCEVHGCRGRWDADQPHTLCGKATTTAATERCCNGRCKRKQPPMVMRSELTGTWWVVLRYKDLGEGRFEALDKHVLAEDTARQLEEMRSRLPVYAPEESEEE